MWATWKHCLLSGFSWGTLHSEPLALALHTSLQYTASSSRSLGQSVPHQSTETCRVPQGFRRIMQVSLFWSCKIAPFITSLPHFQLTKMSVFYKWSLAAAHAHRLPTHPINLLPIRDSFPFPDVDWRLLEQSKKSRWFHVRKLDFCGGGGHSTVEHGIKDGAPDGQNKPSMDTRQRSVNSLLFANTTHASVMLTPLTCAQVFSECPFLFPPGSGRRWAPRC